MTILLTEAKVAALERFQMSARRMIEAVDNQQSDDAFADFLKARAEEENVESEATP